MAKDAPRGETNARDLKYHVAATADGFIAREYGSIDGFVNEGDHAADYLASLKNDYDVALMGRGTYEFGLRFGVTDPYPWMKRYVFSHTMEESPDPNVEIVSGDVFDLVRGLKEQEGKDIYLCGGADLAATLLAENLIDEIVLELNPVVFGSGVPLFSGPVKQTGLELADSKTYDSGVVLLRYRVKRRIPRPAPIPVKKGGRGAC